MFILPNTQPLQPKSYFEIPPPAHESWEDWEVEDFHRVHFHDAIPYDEQLAYDVLGRIVCEGLLTRQNLHADSHQVFIDCLTSAINEAIVHFTVGQFSGFQDLYEYASRGKLHERK